MEKSHGETVAGLGTKLAWDKRSLVITDPDTLKRLNIPYLSPSSAKAVQKCAAGWAFQRLAPRIEDPFSPAAIGTGAHAVLEDLYQLARTKRTHTAALEILQRHADKQWPIPLNSSLADASAITERRQRWEREVTKAYSGIWAMEEPRQVTVKSTEMKLDGLTVAGVPMKGYIDRVDKCGDGTLRIVDYKTGKYKKPDRFGDPHGDQLRLYKSALETKTGIEASDVQLYYTVAGRARQVATDPKSMDATKREFSASWDVLQKGVTDAAFGAKSSPLCAWCPLVSICPVAAGGNYTPQVHAWTQENIEIPVLNAFLPRTVDDYDPYAADDEPTPTSRPEDATAHSTRLSELPASGHKNGHRDTTERKNGTTMTAKPQYADLGKAWEPYVGELHNATAYSTIGAASIVTAAYEQLSEANIRVTRQAMKSTVGLLSELVFTVQEYMTGDTALMDGANTRARGFMYSYLEAHPIPFEGTNEEREEWLRSGIRQCSSMADLALEVLDGNTTDFRSFDNYQPLTEG